MNSAAKLCECGCGERAPVATRTDMRFGAVLGKPRRFVRGHSQRRALKESRNAGRYVTVTMPDGSTQREHVLVAERALGHAMPAGAEVHHVNNIGTDNRPENLVICEDSNYHKLLHRRLRALRECGNADAVKCSCCGDYGAPGSMVFRGSQKGWSHLPGQHRQGWRKRSRSGRADRLAGGGIAGRELHTAGSRA